MYNKVILLGNLTRDVEIRYTNSGVAIASFGLATNRKFKGQDGQQKEEVMFIDVKAFGRTGEIANQFLRKGSKVLVEGRLVLEQWEDKYGAKKSRHSVAVENLKMLDTNTQSDNNNVGYSKSELDIPEVEIDKDEAPFWYSTIKW